MLLKAVIFLLFSLSIVSSLTTRWIGLTGDPHWHNPNNWYCADITRNCTPNALDDVIIQSNPSCDTCARNIIIGPNLTAECFSLQVNATPSRPLSITVQTGLTILNRAYLSNSTRLVVIRYVRLLGTNFTSDGDVVLDGGSLTGNTFYLNNVSISSTGQILSGYAKNIYFRPASTNLVCALVNSTVRVNGSIFSNSSLNLSGQISAGHLIYTPARNNYTLNIMAILNVDNATFYGGNVTTLSGTSTISHLRLFNNTNYRVSSIGRFSNVTGNGTISLFSPTATVQANISDIGIHVYLNYGTFTVGGTCGKIVMDQQGGYSVLNFLEGVTIRNATFLGGTLQQYAPKVNAFANYLYIREVTFFPINFHILNQSTILPSYGWLLFHQNSSLIINPRAVMIQNISLSIGGPGQLVNNGTWEVNGNYTVLSGGFAGTGRLIVNSAVVNLVLPSNITNNITLLNGGTLYTSSNGGRWFLNTINGANSSNVHLNGDYVNIKNVTVNYLADGARITIIDRFKVNNYTIIGGSAKSTNLTDGTIRFLRSYAGIFNINLGQKVNITNATISEQNRLSFSPTTNVTNLYWIGGSILQTGSNGIFRITNTTYLVDNTPKLIEFNTVLNTTFLDCTRCITPGCGLRITDWNHIVAEKTFGCIIFNKRFK